MILHAATSSSGDYDPISVPVTFSNGSADGTETCVFITVNSDGKVESEEYFTVMMALVTSGTSLSLGNKTSSVTLIDSDGT